MAKYAHLAITVVIAMTSARLGDGCLLPVSAPEVLFRGSEGGDMETLGIIFATDYSSCVSQCCEDYEGLCNVAIFNTTLTSEPNCILYLCMPISGCSFTSQDNVQIFASEVAVREMDDHSNNAQSTQSNTLYTSSASQTYGSTIERTTNVELHSTLTFVSTQGAGMNETGSDARIGSQSTVAFSEAKSTLVQENSEDNVTGLTTIATTSARTDIPQPEQATTGQNLTTVVVLNNNTYSSAGVLQEEPATSANNSVEENITSFETVLYSVTDRTYSGSVYPTTGTGSLNHDEEFTALQNGSETNELQLTTEAMSTSLQQPPTTSVDNLELLNLTDILESIFRLDEDYYTEPINVTDLAPVNSNQTDNESVHTPSANTSTATNDTNVVQQQNTISPDVTTTSVIILFVALSAGCILFFTAMVILGRRMYDGWRKRHYSRIDYLVDEMYKE